MRPLGRLPLIYAQGPPMQSKIVAEAARATLDGSIPFPEVVRRLM